MLSFLQALEALIGVHLLSEPDSSQLELEVSGGMRIERAFGDTGWRLEGNR
jgi:hypothetical protein